MKSSILLAASGVIMAMASPVLQERRLFTKTDLVVEWVTVTVTEGHTTVFGPGAQRQHPQISTTSVISSTSTPVPAPVPATSSVPVVVVPPPAPVISTQPAPVPAPAPEPEPAVDNAAPAAPVQQASSDDYQNTALKHHNVHRFNHSAGALTWGDSYASYAATTAASCKFAHDLSPGGGGYGQNIAMWGSSSNAEGLGASGAMAMSASDQWYNGEINQWPAGDYGKANPNMANFEKWGHFSQLVWKDTLQVGCASQLCPAGTMNPSFDAWYTVCNYYPPGNMGGEYGTNVLPPLGQATVKGVEQ
ncbi:CAP domain-containing protein [Bombardia bombarda]|uniref:CAP domain-containing protein n=1 Tax=Bombardia bombarda TaxID=252184 RepID=A0AA39TIC9_9PEZI|nr:CAP domain-containing protein [Bombardia bombarda]